MLKLVKWLMDSGWDFHYENGKLRFIVTNYEEVVSDSMEADQVLYELKKMYD